MIYIIIFLVGIAIPLCILIPRVRRQEKLNSDILNQNKELEKEQKILESECSILESDIAKLNLKKEDLTSSIADLSSQAEKSAQIFYDKSMEVASAKLENSLSNLDRIYQEANTKMKNEFLTAQSEATHFYLDKINLIKEECKNIQAELDNIKETRAALIQARIREKEIKEQKEFYCLNLDEDELEDILILEKIKPRLNKPRILSMLIWTTFYKNKMNSLCAQVLGSDIVCGIYKITNTETDECYIGQAVDMATRWKNHAKAGLGIDTPAGNLLYKAMIEYGLNSFSWELLEATTSDKLNEKEAYYIDLYQSKDYGYNIISGVK